MNKTGTSAVWVLVLVVAVVAGGTVGLGRSEGVRAQEELAFAIDVTDGTVTHMLNADGEEVDEVELAADSAVPGVVMMFYPNTMLPAETFTIHAEGPILLAATRDGPHTENVIFDDSCLGAGVYVFPTGEGGEATITADCGGEVLNIVRIQVVAAEGEPETASTGGDGAGTGSGAGSGGATGSAARRLRIVTTKANAGTLAFPYLQPLAAKGGSGAYGWRVSEGTLPPGLTLQAKLGTISGTPSKEGSYRFTIEVSDLRTGGSGKTIQAGSTATKAFTIKVGPTSGTGPVVEWLRGSVSYATAAEADGWGPQAGLGAEGITVVAYTGGTVCGVATTGQLPPNMGQGTLAASEFLMIIFDGDTVPGCGTGPTGSAAKGTDLRFATDDGLSICPKQYASTGPLTFTPGPTYRNAGPFVLFPKDTGGPCS